MSFESGLLQGYRAAAKFSSCDERLIGWAQQSSTVLPPLLSYTTATGIISRSQQAQQAIIAFLAGATGGNASIGRRFPIASTRHSIATSGPSAKSRGALCACSGTREPSCVASCCCCSCCFCSPTRERSGLSRPVALWENVQASARAAHTFGRPTREREAKRRTYQSARGAGALLPRPVAQCRMRTGGGRRLIYRAA